MHHIFFVFKVSSFKIKITFLDSFRDYNKGQKLSSSHFKPIPLSRPFNDLTQYNKVIMNNGFFSTENGASTFKKVPYLYTLSAKNIKSLMRQFKLLIHFFLPFNITILFSIAIIKNTAISVVHRRKKTSSLTSIFVVSKKNVGILGDIILVIVRISSK